MSDYSSFERAMARMLGRFPFVKGFIKSGYSRLVYTVNRKTYRRKSVAEPVAYSVRKMDSFYGYYDKSPENGKGFVLACVTEDGTDKTPSLEQVVELVVFDDKGRALVRLPVCSHNWQQGCRAQWLSDDLFVYNDFDVDALCYISRVYSIKDKKHVDSYPYPVQDAFGEEYYISLNYQRLSALRPDYGYRNLPGLNDEQLVDLDSDGLWKVDFSSGEAEFLFSISDVCRLVEEDKTCNALHKLNHVLISPNGKCFVFMHRYLINGKRFDRLIWADLASGELRLLADYGMVSHCFWADDSTILGYMRGPNKKDAYWLIDIKTGVFSELPCRDLDKFGDGHPHVHGDWFITDTYPDKARMQHLLWCNWRTGEVKEVGEFFHGFEFDGESRCDLHPRLSLDGKSVYFDSVFSGRRQLYKMDLTS